MIYRLKVQLIIGIGLFLSLLSTSSFSQEKFSLIVGGGFPELLNVGARVLIADQHEFGVSVGVIGGFLSAAGSLSADYYYHFEGTSKVTKRKPWYFRAGVNYLSYQYFLLGSGEVTYFTPRLGRDINLGKRVGIQLDFGPSFVLQQKDYSFFDDDKNHSNSKHSVFAGSISLFVKL